MVIVQSDIFPTLIEISDKCVENRVNFVNQPISVIASLNIVSNKLLSSCTNVSAAVRVHPFLLIYFKCLQSAVVIRRLSVMSTFRQQKYSTGCFVVFSRLDTDVVDTAKQTNH